MSIQQQAWPSFSSESDGGAKKLVGQSQDLNQGDERTVTLKRVFGDRRQRREPFHSRTGLTIIELLVSIAIIAILLALLLPAIMQSRETARRTQCLSHLRNLSLALVQFDEAHRRLPAAGYFYDPVDGVGNGNVKPHHNWAVLILPYIEQVSLYKNWDLDKPIDSDVNQSVSRGDVPVFACPSDISVEATGGNLSYVLNGGWGFTTRTEENIGDCPVDRLGTPVDFNGDGSACSDDSQKNDLDRVRFKQLGLFFVENWKLGQQVDDRDFTRRFHALADIQDGAGQTMFVTENARVGFDPRDPLARFSNPHPTRTMFFIGNPCPGGDCSEGRVDYAQANAGDDRINSGLDKPEGASSAPNSFHSGGVNLAFADGHAGFLSQQIDGHVYAALASPQGIFVRDLPIAQPVLGGTEF